jgi:hypothetical protein
MDKSKPLSERLAALGAATGLKDQGQVSDSIGIIRDRNEDVQLRASALRGISIELAEDADLIDLALALLQDNSEAAEVRKAAFKVLQQSSFSSAVFRTKRAEYLAVLRSLVDDQDEQIRKLAIETLAKEKDEYVQRRLIEGLKEASKALIPVERAVQLLGYDIHSEHYPILKEIVQNPPSTTAKREAVRLLAADPSSKEMLTEILRDKDEYREVRNASAAALQSMAPAEFEDQAKQIVLDDDEYDDIRVACANALDHFANRESLRKDPALKERFEELKEKPVSRGSGQVENELEPSS